MAIPSYVMQTFLLPARICDKMDGMVRKFWWGVADHKRDLYLKAWDILCLPKAIGRLGLRRFRDINLSFITKLGWRLYTDQAHTWV